MKSVSQFSCSVVSDSATPCTAAHQASLSITNCQSLLKLMSIELVMPSNHLILCRPLLLLPSIFPSIRVFSNESALPIRGPKYRGRGKAIYRAQAGGTVRGVVSGQEGAVWNAGHFLHLFAIYKYVKFPEQFQVSILCICYISVLKKKFYMAPRPDTSCFPGASPTVPHSCLTLLENLPPNHRDHLITLPGCTDPRSLQAPHFLLRNISPTSWKQWLFCCSVGFVMT